MRGSMRARSKDTWTLTVYLGVDDKGKDRRQYRTFKGSRRQAESELAAMVAAVETGLACEARSMTVKALFDRWLDLKREQGRVANRTLASYEQLTRLYIDPAIGRLPLSKVRPTHLEKVFGIATERGVSATTRCRVYRVLFMGFKQGVRWQLVPRNPVEIIEPPSPTRRVRNHLRESDFTRLLNALSGHDLSVLAILGIGTGLRLGECLGLRWIDVDLDRNQLWVNQCLQIDGSFSRPKTHRSTRAITMPVFVADALRAQRAAQNERRLIAGAAWADLDLVFDRGDGQAPRLDTTSKRFARAARGAGIDVTFHGLRHGHATLLLASGTDLKVTSQRLGHSSISITANTYTQVISRLDEEAAVSLDAMFRDKSATGTAIGNGK